MMNGRDRLALVDGSHAAADGPRPEADDRHERPVTAELSLLHPCPFFSVDCTISNRAHPGCDVRSQIFRVLRLGAPGAAVFSDPLVGIPGAPGAPQATSAARFAQL